MDLLPSGNLVVQPLRHQVLRTKTDVGLSGNVLFWKLQILPPRSDVLQPSWSSGNASCFCSCSSDHGPLRPGGDSPCRSLRGRVRNRTGPETPPRPDRPPGQQTPPPPPSQPPPLPPPPAARGPAAAGGLSATNSTGSERSGFWGEAWWVVRVSGGLRERAGWVMRAFLQQTALPERNE